MIFLDGENAQNCSEDKIPQSAVTDPLLGPNNNLCTLFWKALKYFQTS
jgi:hypothetical protein